MLNFEVEEQGWLFNMDCLACLALFVL